MTRRRFASLCLALALAMAPALASAVDFVRGDWNADGEVSISDSRYSLGWFFLGLGRPTCQEAGDTNTDGTLNISDSLGILFTLFLGAPPLSAPFPEPGPDPNENDLDCESTGWGEPIEDPIASMRLLDATAWGGDDARVVVPVEVASSTDVAALSLRLTTTGDILGDAGAQFEDLLGIYGGGFDSGMVVAGELVAGYLPAFATPAAIPASEGVVAVNLHFCLAPGTPAGEYELVLTEGELSDFDTGQAIHPALAGATLTVENDVTATDCVIDIDNTVPIGPDVVFELGDASGPPGAPVALPFRILADRPSQGFEFSIDFDEEVLEATDIVKLWTRPNGTPYEFETFEIDNENRHAGNHGVRDEGYLVGAAIITFTDSDAVIPPNEKVDVLELQFRIRPTDATETEVVFEDGAIGASGAVVNNKLIAEGREVTPGLVGNWVFVAGSVNILPDGSLFVRGDANGDFTVDIADPQFTLNYLFLGDRAPLCPDAADANDDGILDISDPTRTLEFLFKGGSRPPAPTAPGSDPTPDALGCYGP